MIRKLLLVRKNEVHSKLMDDLGLSALLVGEPLPIQPIAWSAEAGLSHAGFVLQMKLRQWDEVKRLFGKDGEKLPNYTLLTLPEKGDLDKLDLSECLKSVGLRVYIDEE